MFDRPPSVDDAAILEALRRGWLIDATAVRYLQAGFGSHHWLATGADEASWFVTVDDLVARDLGADPVGAFDALRRAFTVAQALPLDWVVAPLSSRDGGVLRRLDERFSIAVFPHLNGTTTAEYESDTERAAVLALLGQLHRLPVENSPLARRETFRVPTRLQLEAALESAKHRWDGGPYSEPARLLVREHAADVRRTLGEYDDLARRALGDQDGWCLTHGEPHSANVLRSASGLRLIDWDTVQVAPPERDLWMLIPEHGHGDLERQYRDATGHTVDGDRLRLYAIRWDLAETGEYVTQFRAPHSDTADAREGWHNLQDSIVAISS